MTLDWWTLGLQAINVVVLVWILARFFWRPLAAIIEQRRSEAERILVDAAAKRDEAAKLCAEFERRQAGIEQERETALATARAEAERGAATLIADAERKVAAIETASKTTLLREREEAEAEWQAQARRLAVEIARRLLDRLGSSASDERFLAGLLEEIGALPESERVAAGADALEAVSAAPISPENQERYRDRIAAAFGASPNVSFTVDRELLAGLELHGPHLTVHNSWRADLDRIAGALVVERQS